MIRNPRALRLSSIPALAALILLTALVLAPLATAWAAAGDLDPTFGQGGRVAVTFDDHPSGGYAIAQQPDGKLVVAGISTVWEGTGPNPRWWSALTVFRFLPDGSLDPAFGSGGRASAPFEGHYYAEGVGTAYGVVIQPDGAIVIAVTGQGYGSTASAVLFRFTAAGQRDTGFGDAGRSSVLLGDLYAVLRQPDGKFVAAGAEDVSHAPSSAYRDLLACRYLADGTQDWGFGGDPRVWCSGVDFDDGYDTATALTRQEDGRIVLVGVNQPLGTADRSANFAIARLMGDGRLDRGFGSGGKVTTDLGADDRAYAVAVQPDGKLVVAGGSGPLAAVKDVVVIRYLADGSPDPQFGQAGIARIALGSREGARSVVIQPDGKIVVGGEAGGDFALVRLTAEGRLDASFGDRGIIRTHFNEGDAFVRALLLQPDGKLVAAGSTRDTATEPGRVALARYLPDPAPLAADAFGRDVAGGWGGADQGGAYARYDGVPADYAVSNGAGTIRLATAGARRGQMLPAVSGRDVDATFRAKVDALPRGGIAWAAFIARFQRDRSYYLARLRFDPDGRVYLVGLRYNRGAGTRLAPKVGVLHAAGAERAEALVPRLAAAPNDWLDVRVQVAGADPTTVRLKAWADGQPEPADWQYEATDSNDIRQAGTLGLWAYLDWAATNAPLTAAFDDLRVTDAARP